MLTLGIETSQRQGTVALVRDGDCLDERLLSTGGRRHAQTLVAEIDAMLREQGVAPADCDVVAVSIGPGSFTGLRVGVVCAKTFAYATGCRLTSVDTLCAIASNSPADVSTVHVVSDAQRGELYLGIYEREADGVWSRKTDIEVVDGDAWSGQRLESDVVSGLGLDLFGARLADVCRVLPETLRIPQAMAVARVGEQRSRREQHDDPWTLEPFYIRKSAAEEKWDARQRDEAARQHPPSEPAL